VLVKVVLERRRQPGGCALAGWELAEALDVDRDGGQDMLQVGLGLSPVAAVAHAVAAGELADGAGWRAARCQVSRPASAPASFILVFGRVGFLPRRTGRP